jgi:hypothetical protein
VTAVFPALGGGDPGSALYWMSVMSALIAGLMLALAGAATLQEVVGIGRVRANAWAVWFHYPDEAAWRQHVEREWQEERALSGPPWAGLLLLPTLGAGLSWFTVRQLGMPPAIIVPIAALLGFCWVALLVLHLVEVGRAAARYRARLAAPAPRILISRWGLYHEDEGYHSLFWLQDVQLRNVGSPSLTFTTNNSLATRWYQRGPRTVVVTVPAGAEAEAEVLLRRFACERRLRSSGTSW